MSEFTHYKKENGKTYWMSACKVCRNKREYKKRYGIEHDERPTDKFCEICGKHIKGSEIATDHIHGTTEVRGFPCKTCNGAAGLLNDNPDVVLNLFKWLVERGCNPVNKEWLANVPDELPSCSYINQPQCLVKRLFVW